MGFKMVFQDMRLELKELLYLVRREEQYSAAVMSGKIIPSEAAASENIRRSTRISELIHKYELV